MHYVIAVLVLTNDRLWWNSSKSKMSEEVKFIGLLNIMWVKRRGGQTQSLSCSPLIWIMSDDTSPLPCIYRFLTFALKIFFNCTEMQDGAHSFQSKVLTWHIQFLGLPPSYAAHSICLVVLLPFTHSSLLCIMIILKCLLTACRKLSKHKTSTEQTYIIQRLTADCFTMQEVAGKKKVGGKAPCLCSANQAVEPLYLSHTTAHPIRSKPHCKSCFPSFLISPVLELCVFSLAHVLCGITKREGWWHITKAYH